VAGGPFTGTVGQPFTGQMTSTGGVGTVTFTADTLPSGISMDANGVFSGTFGVGNANVTATDSSPTPIVSAPFAVSFTDVAGATVTPLGGTNPDGSFNPHGPTAAPEGFRSPDGSFTPGTTNPDGSVNPGNNPNPASPFTPTPSPAL